MLFRSKIILFFLSWIILLDSCSGSKQSAKEILSADEMVKILVEIHQAEAALDIKPFKKDSILYMTTSYYRFIFNKYHTDFTTFKNSFEYYSKNPIELDAIYQKVVDELTLLQANEYKLNPALKPVPDTTRRPPKIPQGLLHQLK